MKIWKKNLIAAAVLVAVCAGIYVNWLYTEDQTTADLTDTLDASKILSSDMLVMADGSGGQNGGRKNGCPVCRWRMPRRCADNCGAKNCNGRRTR